MKKNLLIVFIIFAFFLSSCVRQSSDFASKDLNLNSTNKQLEKNDSARISLKIGIMPYSSYAPFYFGKVEGYFLDQGLSAELIEFSNQPDLLVALASGQIDVSGGILDIGTLTAINEDTGIKIVADKGYIKSNSDCNYVAWMARQNLFDIDSQADSTNLQGKKFVSVNASYYEYVLEKLLNTFNLKTTDIEIVEMPTPARMEALQTNAIDIAAIGEPWITRTVNSQSGVIWQPFENIVPNAQFGVVWFGPNITKDNPELGNRFMTAYLKSVKQYQEGKTDRNVALLSEFTKSSKDEASQTCWQSFSEDGYVNVDTILDFQNWAFEKGYIDQKLNLNMLWDDQYLKNANNN